MLKKIKTISLSGESRVPYNDKEVVAVHLYANVVDGKATTTNTTVVNQDAYDENIELCRMDIDEFTTWVREVEDSGEATVIEEY